MAPNLNDVERQTEQVIFSLFDDDFTTNRSLFQSDIETDGPEDTFDPALIADKLRQVADALNEDVKFKAALKELKTAAAQETLDQALTIGVDVLCQSHVGQRSEVAPELQIIKATIAFGLFMKKTCPEMKAQLQNSITHFLNRRVGSWVTEQGGWENVVGHS